jgi:hypothetical protein
MKKYIIQLSIVLSLVAVSCRKEHTCDCKTTSTEVRTGFGAQTTIDNTSSTVTTEKQRKKEFKYSENCFSQTYTYNDSGGSGNTAWSSVTTVETTCDLK